MFVRRVQFLLGTLVEIAVPPGFEIARDAAFAAIAHVHARMSFHQPDSDLDAIHCAAVGQVVHVDRSTITVLRAALSLFEASGGLFDVTIAPQLIRTGYLPFRYNLFLNTVNGSSADIEIISDTELVCHARVLIDLGGIAKGYAVDAAIGVLQACGVPSAIVNAGGDLRVLGDTAQDIHVRRPGGGFELPLAIANAALAVSNNVHSRRGSASPHIGRNRQPVCSGASVAIVAPTCMVADAMTKIALADRALASRLLAGCSAQLLTFDHAGPCLLPQSRQMTASA